MLLEAGTTSGATAIVTSCSDLNDRNYRHTGRRAPSVIHSRRLAKSALQWRHNGRDSVSNHQPRDCLLNRLFRRQSKKTSKPQWPVISPLKWPVTRKMFPFDDVIMWVYSVGKTTVPPWNKFIMNVRIVLTVKLLIFTLMDHGISLKC